MAEFITLFKNIGLSEQKAKETVKNENVSVRLKQIVIEAQKHTTKIEKSQGVLLYHLATKLKAQLAHHQPLLSCYIAQGKLLSQQQLDAAMDYLLHYPDTDVDMAKFHEAAGVGVVVTPEQIEKAVETTIQNHKEALVESRYHFNTGILMGEVRKTLKWADGKAVKSEIDMQVLDLLGPKTEDDLRKNVKVKGKPDGTKKGNTPAAKTKVANVAEDADGITLSESPSGTDQTG